MVTSEIDSQEIDTFVQAANLPAETAWSIAKYQRKMERYLFEIFCLDGLEALPARHALPLDLLKRFKKVVSLYDESIQFLLGQLRRRGHTIQCGKECSSCCYHMPAGVSTIELLYAYHGMHESTQAARFFRRCLEVEESWTDIFSRHAAKLGALSRSDSDRETKSAMLKSYHRLERPCPFLERNMCRIYPYRPFACRMHFSLSPPHWCHPAHFQNPYAAKFSIEPGACIYDALDRLDKRFQLDLSDIMVCGLLQLTVNVMRFKEIRWVQ